MAAQIPQQPVEQNVTSALDKAVVRIAAWNNADDQTAENVAAAMEFAALCLEQQQSPALVAEGHAETVVK